MKAQLVLGLLLIATLAMAAAPERSQPQRVEDPCALAKRISQSPPCFAGQACEALELFHESFGRPKVMPTGGGQLPSDLASRLPDVDVTLGKVTSYEDAFRRLGEISGVEVLLHPDVKEQGFAADLGPLPVEDAWEKILRSGGFLTHFDGERLLVAKTPSAGPRQLGRSWAPTFDCRAR